MRNKIKTIAFIVVFILLNTGAFALADSEEIEDINLEIEKGFILESKFRPIPKKETLDLLGLKIEKVDGKWVLKGSESKAVLSYGFENEDIDIIIEDKLYIDILIILEEKEKLITKGLNENSRLIYIDWDGKDRVRLLGMGEGDEDFYFHF